MRVPQAPMKHAFPLILAAITLPLFAQDQAMLDLAFEPPAVNTKPGAEYDDVVRTGNMIIGIDRTPKGRLWAAWMGNGDNPSKGKTPFSCCTQITR